MAIEKWTTKSKAARTAHTFDGTFKPIVTVLGEEFRTLTTPSVNKNYNEHNNVVSLRYLRSSYLCSHKFLDQVGEWRWSCGDVGRGKVDQNTDATLREDRQSRKTGDELFGASQSASPNHAVPTHQRWRTRAIHHPQTVDSHGNLRTLTHMK